MMICHVVRMNVISVNSMNNGKSSLLLSEGVEIAVRIVQIDCLPIGAECRRGPGRTMERMV